MDENCSCGTTSSFDPLNENFLAIILAVLTLMASAISYFWQRNLERKEQAEAGRKAIEDLDRQQALERARVQLSVFVGPLHRYYKTMNTITAQYRSEFKVSSNRFLDAMKQGGQAHWMTLFQEDQLYLFKEDPESEAATIYRNMISRRLKPIYTKIRELVLNHSADLADMPTHEEWLAKYTKETIESPYVGSINVNVILDTYSVWTLEFDDIIESWSEGDYRRMQPTTKVAWIICNDLVDSLYDAAKAKEAKHNKHVKVHKNTLQDTAFSSMTARLAQAQVQVQEKIQELNPLVRRREEGTTNEDV